GLGRMGGAIWWRLRQQGFQVAGWDIDVTRTTAAAERGLRVLAGAQAVAADSDFVISSVTEDGGVRRLFGGSGGLLSANVSGKLFIEMSTLQPMTGRELVPAVEAKGARLIDAPVLGTIPSVQDGKLMVLAGGRAEDVERARAVLDKLARRVIHMG